MHGGENEEHSLLEDRVNWIFRLLKQQNLIYVRMKVNFLQFMLAICWFLNLCYQEDLQQTSVFSSKTWFGTTYGKDIVLLSTIQLWSNFFVFWTCFSSSIWLILDKELTLLISIHILLTMTLSQHCQILQYSSCFPQQSLL